MQNELDATAAIQHFLEEDKVLMAWLRNGVHCKIGIGVWGLLGSAMQYTGCRTQGKFEGLELMNKLTSCVN